MASVDGQPDDVLLVEAVDSVRIVRLNRPDNLNAANHELHARLATVWAELAADEDCRAVVLTGNGRAFCAGGDFEVLSRMNTDADYRRSTL
jgi:enoyl-CoA hydratase